jgi:hypothetical protein
MSLSSQPKLSHTSLLSTLVKCAGDPGQESNVTRLRMAADESGSIYKRYHDAEMLIYAVRLR